MKIWLISLPSDITTDYDTFDSAVVAARTEATARAIHPDGSVCTGYTYTWPIMPKFVVVRLLGHAIPGTVQGVICSSFNAG